MSLLFLLPTLALIAVLLALFVWSLRGTRRPPTSAGVASLWEQLEVRHATRCAQIRQALSQSDFEYLAAKAGMQLAKKVRRERRRVVIAYLGALREDFYDLLRVGRTIAKLSPEVVALREFERFRLTAQFTFRCRMIQVQLVLGMTALVEIGRVSDIASQLAVRIEAALKELGERAAQASKMAQPSTGAV